MNSVGSVLTLIFSLLGTAIILYLCYVFSKFLSKKVNDISTSANMKIKERVALAQDKGLVIVEICGKLYLVGFANNGIEILKELDEADFCSSQTVSKPNFLEILNSTLKHGWDLKANGKGIEQNEAKENLEENEEQTKN